MRTHVRSMPRPMSPPLVSWMVIAVALIVAEALVVYLLRRVPPEICLRVVYLVGVLVVWERVGAGAGRGAPAIASWGW
jgi:hypothetical protein